MSIHEHVTEFAGLPVRDWQPDGGRLEPERAVYRIALEYEEEEAGTRWTDKLARFLEDPAVDRIRGVVVGAWESAAGQESSTPVVEALVAARERLTALRALFLGDIISEESEISWINQSDVSPLLEAYPRLEQLWVRGGQGLVLGSPRHDHLTHLVVQSGGLDAGVVRGLAAAQLPALEHLELWLGTSEYGGTVTLDDLQPLLAGRLFPRLRYLGLRDSEIADAIATALVTAPVLERIRVLDLSLGTLGDEGAAALLASPALPRLEKLDLHHHYCSDAMVARLTALGIEVDASEQQQEDRYNGHSERYVAVSE